MFPNENKKKLVTISSQTETLQERVQLMIT